MTRRDRFRFFLEHAGYATPPGRAACALDLARAEELLERAEDVGAAAFNWHNDDTPYDPGDADTPEQAARNFDSGRWHGPYGAEVTIGDDPAVRPHGRPWSASSLWGIVLGPDDLDDPYARVVRAELASDLADELRAALMGAQVRELADELAARVGHHRAADELRGVLDTIEQEAGR